MVLEIIFNLCLSCINLTNFFRWNIKRTLILKIFIHLIMEVLQTVTTFCFTDSFITFSFVYRGGIRTFQKLTKNSYSVLLTWDICCLLYDKVVNISITAMMPIRFLQTKNFNITNLILVSKLDN